MNQHDKPHWIDSLTDEQVAHRLRAFLEWWVLCDGPVELDGIPMDSPEDLLDFVRDDFESEEHRQAWEREALKLFYGWLPLQ